MGLTRSEYRFIRLIGPHPRAGPHHSHQQAPNAMGPEAHPRHIHRHSASPYYRLYTIETIHNNNIFEYDPPGGLRRSGERVREQREVSGHPHGLRSNTSPQQKPPIK